MVPRGPRRPAGRDRPGQWYLHLFATEQPDLNWSNAEVRADFLHTLRFWSDRGVDGFRVDAAHGLVKDVDGALDLDLDVAEPPWTDGSHPLWDRDELLEDPIPRRSHGMEKGRDGCRVPLPWARSGPSLGSGSGVTTLPQPAGFADLSVEAQEAAPDSTLTLYRRALALRREPGSAAELSWVDDAPGVLHSARPGGWHSVTNFGDDPVALPAGPVLIASAPLDAGRLPANATAWIAAVTSTTRWVSSMR